MLKKTFALAALAGAALVAAAPAFADGYRQHKRVVVVQQHAPQHAQRRFIAQRAPAYRPVIVQRPVVFRAAPVAASHHHSSNNVLGGLILGAMIGAVIANHAGR